MEKQLLITRFKTIKIAGAFFRVEPENSITVLFSVKMDVIVVQVEEYHRVP